jgi:hypothetical protein
MEFDKRVCDYLNENNLMVVITNEAKPIYVETHDQEDGERGLIYRDRKYLLERYRDAEWLKVWLNSLSRAEFDTITFNPASVTHSRRKFNLFTGLAHPRPRDEEIWEEESEEAEALKLRVKPLLDHILLIWCRGDQIVYKFVVKWMAHAAQRPWIKMATALVLRGDEGAGKGCGVEPLAAVLGMKYYYHVKNAKHSLYSTFTPKNYEQCLLMFVDEATCGSKEEAGVLKKLVTETSHEIESKYGARFSIPSFFNVILAANDDWLVPAGFKARRWCCMDVLNDKAGISNAAENRAYFQAIREVKTEDFALFLHSQDVREFDCRATPMTDMLRDQKRRGFDSITSFWENELRHLDLPWGHSIPIPQLHNRYAAYCKSMMIVHVQPSNHLMTGLNKLVQFRDDGRLRPQELSAGTSNYVALLPVQLQARNDFCKKLDDFQWFERPILQQ